MHLPRRHLALAAVLAVPLSSCCSLARLFCGPDKSNWVQIAFDSPAAALATFLEAVRRDNPAVVYQCLSSSFRRAHDLDALSLTAGWERLRADVPGLHLLGYAEIPAAPTMSDGGASYRLEVEGRHLRIDLVRQTFWELRYRAADGAIATPGASLDDTLNGVVALQDDGVDFEGTPLVRVSVELPRVPHTGRGDLALGDLDRVQVGREWKVANIVGLDE